MSDDVSTKTFEFRTMGIDRVQNARIVICSFLFFWKPLASPTCLRKELSESPLAPEPPRQLHPTLAVFDPFGAKDLCFQ